MGSSQPPLLHATFTSHVKSLLTLCFEAGDKPVETVDSGFGGKLPLGSQKGAQPSTPIARNLARRARRSSLGS